jgi:hypothetical protein
VVRSDLCQLRCHTSAGQVTPREVLVHSWNLQRDLMWRVLLLELALVLMVAAVLLGLALLTFNRCLGRMNESPDLGRSLRERQRDRSRARPVLPAAEMS